MRPGAVSRRSGLAAPRSPDPLPDRRLTDTTREGHKMGVTVEFCGEEFAAAEDRPLTIGRVADVEIDDNPYLHRASSGAPGARAVVARQRRLHADRDGRRQRGSSRRGSRRARGSRSCSRPHVWFTAGPTTYDFDIPSTTPRSSPSDRGRARAGGRRARDHRRPGPDDPARSCSSSPSARASSARRTPARADPVLGGRRGAARLDLHQFNRKLDNVCEKLAAPGRAGCTAGRASSPAAEVAARRVRALDPDGDRERPRPADRPEELARG